MKKCPKHDFSIYRGQVGNYTGPKGYKGTIETFQCRNCGKLQKIENNYA